MRSVVAAVACARVRGRIPKGPLPRAAARLLASRATKQIARKAPSHPGFGAMASSALLRGLRIVRTIRCAATPRIRNHCARNATHVGLVQRFPKCGQAGPFEELLTA